MTVAELIEILQVLPSDANLKVAYQPSYPLAAEFEGVAVALEEAVGEEGDERDVIHPGEIEYYEDAAPKEVYLVAGSGCYDTPYAPRECWDIAANF